MSLTSPSRRRLAALVALGISAPLAATLGVPGTAANAEPVGPPVQLVAPPTVTVYSYGGSVYGNLGARLAATDAPVELWSHRSAWSQEIVTTWRSPSGDVSLPAGTMTSWQGLPRFARVTLTDSNGVKVYNRNRRLCLNGDAQRVRPDAPARSPYPYGCPYHAFTKGSVMGIQEGWSVAVTPEMELRIPRGRYTARATMSAPYAELFGLSGAQRTVTWTVKVVRAPDGAYFREAAPRRSPLARPTAQRPTARSAGTHDGPVPDLQSLPAFGMNISPNGNNLRFSATVWNAGDSPMVVDGFRREGEDDVMDAYQYYFDAEGNQTGAYDLVGEMEWHSDNHNHWHFHDFARYRLLTADKTQAVRSRKESFCLANTDAIDYTVPGADWRPENTDLSSACGGRDALSLRQVLSSGSGDTYAQYRAGQAFSLKNLPNGRYYVAVEANPEHHLTESDYDNNVALRRIRIGGTPGARTVTMAPVGVVDDSNWGGF